MHSFKEDAQKASDDPSQAPNSISGAALDKNYRACLHTDDDGNNHPYKVIADENGWKLEFPWFPPPTTGDVVMISRDGEMLWLNAPPDEGAFVLGSRDGVIGWLPTEGCDDEEEEE
jgi:hypothetical protein